MSPPIDELYFTWLYGQVGSVRTADPSRTHWNLLKKLFTTEFLWFIPNDDNRAEDGRALRKEFITDEEIVSVDPDWMRLGCSMLELFIGLSRRLAFEGGGHPKDWFYELLSNLCLDGYTDNQPLPQDSVDNILHSVIWRTYADDGTGGLFPVRGHPCMPQEELWYQMQWYLIERCDY